MKSIEHIREEDLIDFLENGSKDEEITQHLSTCELCQKKAEELTELLELMKDSAEPKAPGHIRLELDQVVQEEKMNLRAKRININYWQVAASVAFLVIGYLFGSQNNNSREATDILALKNELSALKEVTLVSALQNYSASQRIQAVNQIQAAPNATAPSKKLIRALLETLNTDESPNVRYAALQAITKMTIDDEVKEKLVASLKQQQDPLIQIALINFMVELEEKTVIAPLRDLVKKKEMSPEVIRQAKIALDILT